MIITVVLVLLTILILAEAKILHSMNKRVKLLELLVLSCSLEISLLHIETFPIEKEGKG